MAMNNKNEEFLELSRDERIEALLTHIGFEFNKCMEDIIEHEDVTINEQEVKIIINTILYDLSDRMRPVIDKFNELCDDVIIYDVRFIEVDPEKITCKVLPYLELLGDDK